MAEIDYEAFRAELTEFARTKCPDDIRAMVAEGYQKLTRREWAQWQALLFERGWAAPGWAREHGGTGWDLRQRFIFEEVMAANDCPVQYHHGLGHIGPVIIAFGTPEQKARFLPGILKGTDWWCQGYSEPGAGSDLASLITSARREGNEYVVTGQKIWTSHAHEADLIYALVRSSKESRKQDGISLLLVPLKQPGVTVRPIRTIEGWHHLNEVFFDEVRVPASNLIGEEGKGWACAKFLLERERLPPASVPRLMRLWQRVATLLEREARAAGGSRALDVLWHRLLMAEAELKGAYHLLTHAIDDMMNERPLGAKPSALKLMNGELGQRIMSIALDAVGPDAVSRLALADDPDQPGHANSLWVENHLFFRSRTLAGGTGEVQRNVIARELLRA